MTNETTTSTTAAHGAASATARTTRISVVVSTRNRPEHAVGCASAILANDSFGELLVVDQSDDDSTERALASIADTRLRYVRTSSRGVTRSRNIGAEQSVGDVIAFTDDDCRPAADWVAALQRLLDRDPEAAVVCGRVRVAEEVRGLGFTESFEPRVREWRGRFPPFGSDWGITANLAARRAAFEQLGGFDPMLGAGAPLRSGGEPDFLFRALRAGYKVVNAVEVSVDHLGVRPDGEASQRLIRGYGYGTGAALFKHVRMADLRALQLYLKFVGANIRRALTGLLRTGRPDGFGFLVFFLWGSISSFRYRVDRRTRRYIER